MIETKMIVIMLKKNDPNNLRVDMDDEDDGNER